MPIQKFQQQLSYGGAPPPGQYPTHQQQGYPPSQYQNNQSPQNQNGQYLRPAPPAPQQQFGAQSYQQYPSQQNFQQSPGYGYVRAILFQKGVLSQLKMNED